MIRVPSLLCAAALVASCATAGPPPPPAEIVPGYVAVELLTEPNVDDASHARRLVERLGGAPVASARCGAKDCSLACLPVWCVVELAAPEPPDAAWTREVAARVAAGTDDELVRVSVVCHEGDRSQGCEARLSSARPLPQGLVPRLRQPGPDAPFR